MSISEKKHQYYTIYCIPYSVYLLLAHLVQFWTKFIVLNLFNHSVSATESVFITNSKEEHVPPELSSLESSFCDDI